MKTRAFKSRNKLRFELYLVVTTFRVVLVFWVIWIDGMGWSVVMEGGNVSASISGATGRKWKDWKDDRTDVSW